METIPWWDVLTKANRELRMEDPMSYRLERLHQPLPISAMWAQMVGLWGGQKTAAEVSKIVKKSTRAVRSYAQARKLKLATRNNPARPQASIALEAFRCVGAFEKERNPVKQAAEWVGILPVEALYYRRAVPVLCELLEEPADELLDYSDDELQQLWLQAGLRLYYPRTTDEQAAYPAEASELLAHPLQ